MKYLNHCFGISAVAPSFKGTDVNIRIIEALLIGGINYMVLHSSSVGTTFCGIDINNVQDRRELMATLEQITQWAYYNAKKCRMSSI